MGKAVYLVEWGAIVSRKYLGAVVTYKLSLKYNVSSKPIIQWKKRYKEQGITVYDANILLYKEIPLSFLVYIQQDEPAIVSLAMNKALHT